MNAETASSQSPAVVVVAYDRPEALRRLLTSLTTAHYERSTPLIISVDRSDSEDTLAVARGFHWEHGPKEVLARSPHLGLRSHVLACGDLVREYGSIVMLEDDLFVAPSFHEYARAALVAYESDPSIAGVALYAQAFNETAGLPFVPLDDGHPVYFSQMACSWGQAWSGQQWESFRSWLAEREGAGAGRASSADPRVPPNVRAWSSASWKKDFVHYLVSTGKYFVYPRVSLTTNFGDRGTHHMTARHLFQVPLGFARVERHFVSREESGTVYDAYWEMTPACLRRWCPDLPTGALAVDLYGQRDLTASDELVLTSRPVRSALRSYGRDLRPHELNVISQIPGDVFRVARNADCSAKVKPTASDMGYHHATALVAPTTLTDIVEFYADLFPAPLRSAIRVAERLKRRLRR